MLVPRHKSHSQIEQENMLLELRLQHIYGRCVVLRSLSSGGKVAFFDDNPANFFIHMKQLEINVFATTSKRWLKIKQDIEKQIKNLAQAEQEQVVQLIETKIEAFKKTGIVTHKDDHKLEFIRSMLGGSLTQITSSGSPLSSEAKAFLQVALSLSITELYAGTEMTGCWFMTKEGDKSCRNVGGPSRTFEFYLQDVPLLQYTHKDSPYPRGQILVRGTGVFAGYYKQPEKTKEALDQDGWYHTGDVGMLKEGGALQIIDRVKNLFKLKGEEIIIPSEMVEQVYLQSRFVHQIFVHGGPTFSHIVAVVVPNKAEVEAELGADEYFKESEKLRKLLRDEMEKAGKLNDLRPLEFVEDKFYIELTPWSEADLLSPLLKLKRSEARAKYAKIFEALQ